MIASFFRACSPNILKEIRSSLSINIENLVLRAREEFNGFAGKDCELFLESWSTLIADLGMRIAEFSSSFRTSSMYFQSETGNPPEGWESEGQIRDLQSEM